MRWHGVNRGVKLPKILHVVATHSRHENSRDETHDHHLKRENVVLVLIHYLLTLNNRQRCYTIREESLSCDFFVNTVWGLKLFYSDLRMPVTRVIVSYFLVGGEPGFSACE